MVDVPYEDRDDVARDITPQMTSDCRVIIRFSINDVELLDLAELTERTIPGVEEYRAWLVDYPNAALRKDPALATRAGPILGLIERMRDLTGGTFRPAPDGARGYQTPYSPGGPCADGTPRSVALKEMIWQLADWLLRFEYQARNSVGPYPVIDDDDVQEFAATARRLRALCGPSDVPAETSPDPTPDRPPDLPKASKREVIHRLGFRSKTYWPPVERDFALKYICIREIKRGGSDSLWDLWILRKDLYRPESD